MFILINAKWTIIFAIPQLATIYISKCHLQALFINFSAYRIAGNFRGRKLLRNWRKYDRGENFSGLLAFAVVKDAMPQISWRKLSRIATKLRNSWKFSCLKVFRYYFSTHKETTLQCTLLKKNKDMNYWTHSSSWRLWFTRKASLSARTPSLIWFQPRLQNVREQEMRSGSTNLFTLCKVYLVLVPH